MDELHEKSCCGCCCHCWGLSMDQNGCSALAEAWLANCSCISSRQSKVGVLPFPARKQEAGVGWRGAEQLHLFCSWQQCEAALPCQTFSKDICGTALERVKAGFMCLGTSPALLNPHVASCPFHPGAMLLGDWQKHHESAVINAAGCAVPSEGSWLLCHFPGAILGNYPYLWQENRLLMHQHSCFDTFDE